MAFSYELCYGWVDFQICSMPPAFPTFHVSSCSEVIAGNRKGYCSCHNRRIRIVKECHHSPLTCDEVCAKMSKRCEKLVDYQTERDPGVTPAECAPYDDADGFHLCSTNQELFEEEDEYTIREGCKRMATHNFFYLTRYVEEMDWNRTDILHCGMKVWCGILITLIMFLSGRGMICLLRHSPCCRKIRNWNGILKVRGYYIPIIWRGWIRLRDIREIESHVDCKRFDDFHRRNHCEGRICVICLEQYKAESKLWTLNCGHHFHKECGSKWLLLYTQTRACPICRQDIVNAENQHGRQSSAER